MQVIFIADFCQLAPVPNPQDVGKYCFLSPLWSAVFPSSHYFLLTIIFRQNPAEFIHLLNEVRLSPVLPEWVQNKLEQLACTLEPMPGKQTPQLNCKVFECFIFNREKLHHSTNNDDINPSSPGDTIWRTQLLAPYSGYPHMVSLCSCSESRIPPYGVSYFTAKNNHLQFDWLIFDNSKQFFDCLSVF